jgi:long-chain acyl-CoA synthetase
MRRGGRAPGEESDMVETLSQLVVNTVARFPKDDLMLSKREGRWVPISTREFGEAVRDLALGFAEAGVAAGDKLVILSENRPEWVLVDLANLCLGGVTVPVYPTLMPEQVKYIIDDSEATVVVCSGAALWSKVRAVRRDLPRVRRFFLMDGPASDGAVLLDELRAQGRTAAQARPGRFEELVRAVQPDDLASIIYTSGTTGVPKGVMLTHRNFVSNVVTLTDIVAFDEKDLVLSFLPLSHVLERMTTFAFLYKGCSIAHAESVETVAENLLEVRPQIMISVPRLFDKIYAKVMDQVLAGSGLKKAVFFWALRTGKKASGRRLAGRPVSGLLKVRNGLARKLVFSKILAKTGGRVRFFVSGGAPLSKDIAEFFFAIGLTVLEGYGLTETAPVLAVNTFENIRLGTVGKPIPGVDIKIAADGEILARGPNVMKGYFNKEAETREVLVDGWLHTGDIGHLDPDGYLVITDRKKDLIITAGGKNVAPQPIENLLKTIPVVANAVVLGGSRKFISALIVPDFDKLTAHALATGIPFATRRELVLRPEAVDFVMAAVDAATAQLAPFERIKKIALLDRDFEIEAGEMTPTLKVRRSIVEAKYKDIIDALYRE